MPDSPLISVVMPVFNTERYLPKAIESILDQTCIDFEFIIIDDGSTDNAYVIAETYAVKDSRIRLYRNEKNLGVSVTLNRGLDLAVGKYIARMDSDDISLPQRFERQVEFLEANPKIAVVGAQYVLVDENDEYIMEPWYPTTPGLVRWYLFFGCPLQSVMINSEFLNRYHFRYKDHATADDYDLWVKIAEKFQIANLAEVLMLYRKHQNNITSTRRQKMVAETHRIIRDLINNSIGIELSTEQIIGWLKSRCVNSTMDAFILSRVITRLERYTRNWEITREDRRVIRREASAKIRAIWGSQQRTLLLLPYVLYSIILNPVLPGEWLKEKIFHNKANNLQ